MSATTTTSTSVFVQLAGEHHLRITVRRDDDGQPSWIVLQRGFGVGPDWRPDGSGAFTISASSLPDVRGALEELDAS